jgi:hypothetical protein
MPEEPKNLDRFKTQMPQIPGVTERSGATPLPSPSAEDAPSPTIASRIVGPIVAVLVIGALGTWLFLRVTRTKPAGTPDTATASRAAAESSSAPLPAAPVASPGGSNAVATLEELAKPWSSKTFVFHSRIAGEAVEAMVVRLPGPANRPESYWAFSLQQPFGRCKLEWVTDRSKISNEYGYSADHPMVASPCDGTLYDPMKLGTIPNGAWARGEVVHGAGIRPPIAIELRVEGNQLIATRIE